MKDEKHINLHSISEIELFSEKISNRYFYVPYQPLKTFLGITIQKEIPAHWRYCSTVFDDKHYTSDEINNMSNLKVDETQKLLYSRANIVITLNNGNQNIFYFESDSQMQKKFYEIREMFRSYDIIFTNDINFKP